MSTLRFFAVSVVLATSLLAASGCKKSCADGGEDHADGTSWQCSDGCNSCSCTEGVISSTLAPCGPRVDAGLPGADTGSPVTDARLPAVEAGAAAADSATPDASQDAGLGGDAAEAKGCGARLGDTCSEDEYCAYELGQLCGAADATARCRPRPEVCADIHAPTCGCDGDTYGNACEAARAGTGVNTLSECPN